MKTNSSRATKPRFIKSNYDISGIFGLWVSIVLVALEDLTSGDADQAEDVLRYFDSAWYKDLAVHFKFDPFYELTKLSSDPFAQPSVRRVSLICSKCGGSYIINEYDVVTCCEEER